MARVAGRSVWIAWPVGVLCAAVIAGLAVLAAPGLPGAVTFVGDTLRAGSTTAPWTDAPRVPGPATTCRDLYTQPMWSTLVWSPEALLTQRRTGALSTPEAVAAAGSTPVVTCHWRGESGRWLETSVATVSAEGAAAVAATLTGQGFACAADGDATHCERTAGDVVEVHDLRGDRWVSSMFAGWMPDGYAAIVASRAVGE
ncbi:hypothetical protein D8Y23_08055 [Microbacterium enclense]|uniref:Uncharacterized protein n=1 Tax=Microbacterium enclense TaxID=993073 RepID=A0A443JF11_9MICO|nr:hypothetical protein [Microbacterium enclense]RWR19156.1 hypothetical protein D8Y23_08055 [Microbacterium enclense]